MQPRFAICNVLHGAQMMFSEDMSAALCRAINNWLAAEWLDRDPRLRASIVVPVHSPDLAAEEIERWRRDRRFVQVLMLAMTETAAGPAAELADLRARRRSTACRSASMPAAATAIRRARSAGRRTTWRIMSRRRRASPAVLNCLLAEGVFQKFPDLSVVLIESGVTWLPANLWRINKTWRGVRAEVPWLDRPPAEIVREHVRLTVQPFDAPPEPRRWRPCWNRSAPTTCCCSRPTIRTGTSTGTDAMPAGLPTALLRKMLVDNAAGDLSAADRGVAPPTGCRRRCDERDAP